ncbi:hypothetical protein BJX99DRAFT_260015 [Aspergillus californicus]
MTNKYPNRQRFYRNLQNLQEKNESTLLGLKHAPSTLPNSDTRSRFSTHSVDFTKYQHQHRHPSPDPNKYRPADCVAQQKSHPQHHIILKTPHTPSTLPRLTIHYHNPSEHRNWHTSANY